MALAGLPPEVRGRLEAAGARGAGGGGAARLFDMFGVEAVLFELGLPELAAEVEEALPLLRERGARERVASALRSPPDWTRDETGRREAEHAKQLERRRSGDEVGELLRAGRQRTERLPGEASAAAASAADAFVRGRAETALKDKWARMAAAHLLGTETPAGVWVAGYEDPLGQLCLLAAGRRGDTLRGRVRVWSKYVDWMVNAFGCRFPKAREHLVAYLRQRADEPCGKSTLRSLWGPIVFCEKLAGVAEHARLSKDSLVEMYYGGLLAAAPQRLDGVAMVRKAPRLPLGVLAALEEVVLDPKEALAIRLWAWWKLVQAWACLRFDDHRGWVPGKTVLREQSLRTMLVRTKTRGRKRRCRGGRFGWRSRPC